MGAFMTRSLVAILVSCSVCLCAFLAGSAGSLAQTAERPLSFNRDIRPILSDKCLACHGQDAKKREADLRLDTFEGATADLGGTRAIIPGDLEQSELWVRVNSSDEDEVMPPPASHKSLNEAEKTLLKQWITQGAAYQKHWAFEPIQRPAVPQIAGAPQPVDAFLAERLQQVGLTPQPPADRETLIRRVALTITGLPRPSPRSMRTWRTKRRKRTSGWSTATWLRRATARKWRATGWMWRGMPIPTDCTSTTNA